MNTPRVHSTVADTPLESLTIQPGANGWRTAARRAPAGFSRGAVDSFRAGLGLPDGPVLMSGHQAELWHPGILAKYFATLAAARALGCAGAWVVVDQDTGAPERIAYPALNWSRRVWALSHDRDDVRPLCARATVPPGAPPGDAMCAEVGGALARVRDALARAAGEASIARQFTRATLELLAPLGQPPRFFFASDLAHTALFREFAARMFDDHARCVSAYNTAAARHPEAGVRALRPGAELPLWVLSPTGSRLACTLKHAGAPLLPRALTLTALLRLAGCELFVHGLGGGVYDRITEEWLREWLGAELSPTAVVSATRFPRPVGAPPAPDARGAAAAMWRAHRARHDPSMLGDHARDAWRRDILARIARTSGAERRALYLTLHAWLKSYREQRADQLDALEREARALGGAARAGKGAWDRTWPFVFLGEERLVALRDEIGAAFAGGGAR